MADLPDNHTAISKDLQDSLADLAHKHVHVSYALIGIIVVVLAVGGVFAYFSNAAYERAMQRAEASETLMQQYKAQSDSTIKQYQQALADNQAARAADTQKIMDLEKQIASQNAAAQIAIGNALKPGKSAQEAYGDLVGAYKGILNPALNLSKDTNGEQLLGFRVPEVQRFTADKIDLDNKTKVTDQQVEELKTKDKTIASLNADLANGDAALTDLRKTDAQCQQTVADYKKVAKKSRFRKILDGFIKGAIFVAGVELGHKL